jgi:hypothetical protein
MRFSCLAGEPKRRVRARPRYSARALAGSGDVLCALLLKSENSPVFLIELRLMTDEQTTIIGLKRELKSQRDKARELRGQVDRWRRVTHTLRALAGLDDEKFNNLLRSESLFCD